MSRSAEAFPFFCATYRVDALRRRVCTGEKVFKECIACHAVGDGAENKAGRALNGNTGHPAGQVEGFKYSNSMMEKPVAVSCGTAQL
ncbi:c-type cytochrome [Roseibium sp.]|uniref:c-type cytochrome n=1 Tax=Roseibium sp. TaxID=1936156 RepID=UPI003D0B2578